MRDPMKSTGDSRHPMPLGQGPAALPATGDMPGDLSPVLDLDAHIDVAKYLHALRRRWMIIAAFCLVGIGYAVVHHTLTPKEYQAKTLIQIERKRLSMLTVGQAGWMEDWWNLEYYPTQYRLLRSRGMAERVVLGLRLHEDPTFANPQLGLTLAGKTLDELDDQAATQLARLASRLQGRLEVRPVAETQMVELIYRSTSPERAAQIANAYAQTFIEWGKRTRGETVGKASEVLDKQIDTLRMEIEEGQRSLNAFTTSGEYALDPAGEALLERRQTLERQYNTVVAERISKESAYRGIQNLSPEVVANTHSGGEIGALQAQLSQLEIEYESKLETFKPTWHEMVELQNQITQTRDQLDRRIEEIHKKVLDQSRAEFEQARQEERSLVEEQQRLAVDARLQNSDALEYSNRLTYIETRKELLAEMLKRQSEVTSQIQSSQESNVTIVDKAIVPTSAFYPSLTGNLATAMAISVFMGVGLILLIEYLDRTIRTAEELERVLGLPTLAVIPDAESRGRSRGLYGQYGYGGKGKRRSEAKPVGAADEGPKIELLPNTNPKLAISEAYRSLRTALTLSSAEEVRVLALTSASPSEGKTATIANLGVVWAQLGKRVLLIDADLRRPRMHKVFGVSRQVGLVNCLAGQADPKSVILQTEVPNLFVCPSGPVPPNPSELLASDRMRDFIDAMRKDFVVLIDTPPTLPVTDTIILGSYVDGLVICARAGRLQRKEAKLCVERLRYAEVRVFGSVLNRYRESHAGYSRYRDYYGVYEEPQATSNAA